MPRNPQSCNDIDSGTTQGRLWLADDVAEYLRISKTEVYRLVERREIPHSRIFKRKGIRFHPDEIEKWARFDRGPDAQGNADG